MPEPSLIFSDLRFPEAARWHDDQLWFSDMHTGQVGGSGRTRLFLLTSNSWQPSETTSRAGCIEAVEVGVPG